jgi:hypothetical protein
VAVQAGLGELFSVVIGRRSLDLRRGIAAAAGAGNAVESLTRDA